MNGIKYQIDQSFIFLVITVFFVLLDQNNKSNLTAKLQTFIIKPDDLLVKRRESGF